MHTDIQDEWLKNAPLRVRQQAPPVETNITKLRLVILEAYYAAQFHLIRVSIIKGGSKMIWWIQL